MNLIRAVLRTTLALFAWAGATAAGADSLAVGEPAPAFALTGSDGRVHRLADHRGRWVVLAWFPKAFTGG